MAGRDRGPERPGNIAPLAVLPVFFKLSGRRALLAGGTPPAVWKAELLAAAGADVLVAAPAPCAEMEDLAAALPARLRLERRGWRPEDLDGAALAVGAFEGEEGGAFRAAARAAGVPVNVIDVPSLCDFQFGTIVERSPLVIGISTDGAAPVFGQALRARIEALLPPETGAWARAAKDWRAPLQALKLGFASRRRFWERFADMALEGGARAPTEADRAACMAAALATEGAGSGRVVMVGAGPGEPDLVTLRAVRALQSADVIVHEGGVVPAVLGLGRREAKREAAGREAALRVCALAAEGKAVAWVGPGDAHLCPVWIERAGRLAGSGLPVETARGPRCEACPRGCAIRPAQ